MLQRLFLLFIVVPLLELTLLLIFAELVGWVWSVLLVLVTGILGAWLARRQGSGVIRKLRSQVSAGSMPTDVLLDGALIFFAGGLLLTPGIITDIVGITLMIPSSRRWYKRRIVNWFNRHFQISQWEMPSGDTFRSDPVDESVVDGAVVPDDDGTREENSAEGTDFLASNPHRGDQ